MAQPALGKNKKGFVTLMATLLLAAVGISVSVSLLLMGLGSSRTSLAMGQSYQAKALANACAEEALQKVYEALPAQFLGTGNLSLGQGTCSYAVTAVDVANVKITATGTVADTVRKCQVITATVGPATISSWQEVSDFN